jgi:hypothetical protein
MISLDGKPSNPISCFFKITHSQTYIEISRHAYTQKELRLTLKDTGTLTNTQKH